MQIRYNNGQAYVLTDANGNPKIRYVSSSPNPEPPPESTTLPQIMAAGGGDPHMKLRIKNGAIIARWDDNSPSSAGTELLFFHVKTNTDTVSVFYTNRGNGPCVIESVRYIYNGNSVSNFSGTIQLGPVSLIKSTYAVSVSVDTLEGVIELGGAVSAVLGKAAQSKTYLDGGWGSTVDGLGNLGITRTNFVVGSGVTINNDNSISSAHIYNTSELAARQIFAAISEEFIGAKAQEKALPLDPVALVLADIAAPGGDFDGFINPPENVNGIIDVDTGATGSGLYIYGDNYMPEEIAGVGNYDAIDYDSSSSASSDSSSSDSSSSESSGSSSSDSGDESLTYYCVNIT